MDKGSSSVGVERPVVARPKASKKTLTLLYISCSWIGFLALFAFGVRDLSCDHARRIYLPLSFRMALGRWGIWVGYQRSEKKRERPAA